jgi:hypothetical protein
MAGRHDDHGGYERTDAAAGATFRAGLVILGVMFLTALALVPMFRLLGREETARQPPPAEVVKTEMSEPAQTFPRLVTAEPRVLAAFRAQEDALLSSYGWVEKDKGLVRIPIAEAMKIVAERGLPRFEASAEAADKTGGKK